MRCVNSLNRETSISTALSYIFSNSISTVSIPLNGKRPFLLTLLLKCRRIPMKVSIPFTGKRPFLLPKRDGSLKNLSSVNSLYRETSISTVSSHKPLKSRLTGLIFAGNCLNILITSLYSSLLCFSKNCICLLYTSDSSED